MTTDVVWEVVRRHLQDYEVRSINELGEGLDHAVFEVNGELVVRMDHHHDAGRAHRIRRECRLLTTVAAASPVPVPRPVFCSAEEGLLAYRKLDGHLLLEVPPARRARLAPAAAAALGRLLAEWQSMPPDSVRGLVDIDDTPLVEWQAEANCCFTAVAARLSRGHEQSVREFLAAPVPSSPPRRVFSHNDLGIEHVLVDLVTGAVTGVLDWSDAAITDPARDFGLIFRDLGPVGLDAALDAYGFVGEDPARFRERVIFYSRCAGLEDLAYGLQTRQAVYVEKSLAALGWLFPDVSSGAVRR